MNPFSFVKASRDRALRKWNKSRLRHISSLTKEEWIEDLNDNFDYAKKMSDFVGFFIRWSFLNFALLYFLDRSPRESNIFLSYVFGFCAIIVFAFQLVFSFKIYGIMQSYWNADAAKISGGTIYKSILYVFSFIQAFALFIGASALIREVAKSSALLSK